MRTLINAVGIILDMMQYLYSLLMIKLDKTDQALLLLITYNLVMIKIASHE